MAYKNSDVSVDDHFARFGSKSYAIDKINSVNVITSQKPTAWFLWFLIGGFLALMAFAGIKASVNMSIGCGIIAALFLYLGVKSWQKSRVVWHRLLLATSGGEVQAIQSDDGEFVGQLRFEIEQAMRR